MATTKKYYMVCKFETEEEYTKHYKSIFNSGYERGFEDGRVDALSNFLNVINQEFKHEQQSAAYLAGEKSKKRWKLNYDTQEAYAKQRIKEYCEKHNVEFVED